jgi:tRNA threonylcarbamoyl adenosine modification protein YeaZ
VNVLAIETSAIFCSIALFKDEQIFCKQDTNKSQHGKVILALIDELLEQSQLSLEQIDKILISYGPGSFTGLRVGCGVAQSFNLIHGIKCFGISSLKVLASTAYQNESKGKVVSLISLGMGEFAASKFDDKESLLDKKTEEFILQNEELETFLREHKDYHVITSSENTDMMNILDSKNFSFIQPEAKSMFEFFNISDVASPQSDSFIVPNYLSNKDHWK